MNPPRPSLWMFAVLALAFATSLRAADALELARLRAAYAVAVGNAARPVIQEHLKSLGLLRDASMRSSKLDVANKVQGEMDRATAALTKGDLASPAAEASTGAIPELDKLRAAHVAAMDRTLKPLRDTYVRELEKLRDFYAKSANLDGANAAQTELTALKTGDAASPTSAATSGAKPTVVSQVGDEKFFVNKSWYSAANAEYHFDKEGSGYRLYTGVKAPFTWRKLDTGIVEVAGRMVPGGPQTMWYFKFDNKKTALFGKQKESQADPLRSDK